MSKGVRVLEHLGVEVGRRVVHAHPVAGLDLLPADLGVLVGGPLNDTTGVDHRTIHRLRSRDARPCRSPLIGVLHERDHPVLMAFPRRLIAGDRQQDREEAELVRRQF